MLILAVILGILTILYSACVWLFFSGLHAHSQGQNSIRPAVSVVVAARDEEQHIGACLRSVLNQTYRGDVDITVADDGSVDDTASVVAQMAREDPRLKLVPIRETPSDWAPKKFALAEAIAHSGGDIIMTTDADCLVPPTWIEEMIRHFEPPVGVVTGMVELSRGSQKSSLWKRLQDLELFSLFMAAAGGMRRGLIRSATGGNLAYRRQAFVASGGFEAIKSLVSGDDDLLLQQILATTGWQARFSLDPGTVVTTAPHSSLRDFFHQRRRWASKAPHQHSGNFFFLLVTFLLNLFLLASPVSIFSGLKWFLLPLACLVIKALSELALLWRGGRRLGRTKLLSPFPIWELLHIPYVVLFGLVGLAGELRWKGRRYRGQRGTNTGCAL